jgi:hypothetical protein
MVRRKPKRNEIVIGVFLIVIGLAVVGFTFSDTSFTSITNIVPLQLIPFNVCAPNTIGFGQISFGDIECFQSFNSFRTDSLPFRFVIPLVEVDTNAPIILDYDFIAVCPTTRDDCAVLTDPCSSFATDPGRIFVTDENGILIHTGNEVATDIQPLLLPNQQTLILNFDDTGFGVCPTGEILYSRQGTNGLTFLFRAPEISEIQPLLLEQWLYLADFRDNEVVESATNFAIAESFQLENPTVITDLRVRIGTGTSFATTDADTKITAFVWNLDETPPKRIAQADTFTGISKARAEQDLDFRFPTTIVLLPTQNNVPINYAVGIKVEQSPSSEFVYTKSDQIAATHKCVIETSGTADAEGTFVDNGLCGFDIRHSPFRAFTLLQAADGTETESQILDRLTEIENTILSTDDELTRTELTAILCEGISPQPAICQVGLTANSCGVTEFFFEGDCLCNAGYDRVESGDCELRDTSLLNIGDFTQEELAIVGIGLLILVIGAIAIAFARKR